jgi:hypothetical protein
MEAKKKRKRKRKNTVKKKYSEGVCVSLYFFIMDVFFI